MRCVGRSLGCALAIVVAAGAARGDDASAESEGYIQRGIELRQLGQNREALDVFQTAYGLHPSPRAAAQVALAHQALGDWVEAERGLDAALRVDDPWIARYRDALESALVTVRAHLGWLHVEADPPRAELVLDGASTVELPDPDPIRVVAGTREIDVRAPGRAAAHRTVTVSSAARVEVLVALEPLPAAPDPAPAAEPSLRAAPPPAADGTAGGSPTVGYAALAAAGVLAGGGIVAWRIREDNAAIYNDDGRCLIGAETRDQRCGGRAQTADVALGFEIGAFALAAASAGFGVWRLSAAGTRASRVSTLPCAPWMGLGVACGGRF